MASESVKKMHRHSSKALSPVTFSYRAFSSCDHLQISSLLHTIACDLLQYVPTLLGHPFINLLAFPLHSHHHSHQVLYCLTNKLSRARKKKTKKKKKKILINMMNGSACIATMVVLLILFPTAMQARHIGKAHSRHGHHRAPLSSRNDQTIAKPEAAYWDKRPMMYKRADPLQIAGSSLPDCSHACGSCTPCRLVMVSFVCSSLEEAETCPMAYKCMCHNKSYPVP